MKKRGSAMLFVILIIAVLFTLSLGVIQITLASLRHSSSYYYKNQAFYYADSSTDKALYYLDMIADKARDYANDYCFTESGAFNLSNADIKNAYDEYLTDGNRDKLEETVRRIFVFRFSEYLRGVLHGSQTIELDGATFNGEWKDCRDYITDKFYPTGNKSSLPNIDLEFYTFEDFKNLKLTEYNKLFPSADESKFFNYPLSVDKSNEFPKETIITKVYLKDSNTLRYMITTFEFNPFKDKIADVSLTEKKIKRGYNGILDYAIVTGRNLIIANNDKTLTVNGDVYVKGTGNDNTKNYTSDTYGGILVGMNQSTLDNLQSSSRENRIENLRDSDVPKVKGRITINGKVYAGGLPKIGNSEQLNSGYIRTVVSGSQITVNGDLYCNSIITDEGADSSKIDVKNVYISDNVSLYGDDSDIDINGDLVSFEKADSDTNFNASSSIVVDAEDAKLTVTGKVVLFGVAFIDGLIDENNDIFKTMETTAINPNYALYNFKYYDIYNNYFLNFKLKDDTNYDMNMFDTRKSEKDVGKAFILDTLYKSKETLDFQYNFGENIIDAPNIKTKASDSYFPFFFVSNGKIYMSGNTNITPQNSIDTIKDRVKELEQIPNTLDEIKAKNYADNNKKEVIKKLKFQDKGIDTANSFEDYLDFSKLTEISIDNPSKKILIKTSRDNIEIDDFEKYKNYNVLLISEKNIILDCNDVNTSVKGNIICKGDLVIKGGFSLEQNRDESKKLMNYYNSAFADKCNELYRLLAPGTTAEDYYEKDIYSGIKKQNVKTNIDIISKRQMLGVK